MIKKRDPSPRRSHVAPGESAFPEIAVAGLKIRVKRGGVGVMRRKESRDAERPPLLDNSFEWSLTITGPPPRGK